MALGFTYFAELNSRGAGGHVVRLLTKNKKNEL